MSEFVSSNVTSLFGLVLFVFLSFATGNVDGEKCPEAYGYMCMAGNAGKRTPENVILEKGPLSEYFFSKKHRKPTLEENDVLFPELEDKEDDRAFDRDPVRTKYPHLERVDPHGLLYTWLRSLPNNFFNIRNRLRLAYLFRDARSKHDIARRLMKASRPTRLYRSARHSHMKPHHPSARLIQYRTN